MRFSTILGVVIGLFSTSCAAAPLQPAQQASDLSWVHSNTTLYATTRSGVVATALSTGKSTVLVSGIGLWGGTFLLSPDKTQLFFGGQDTGYRMFDLRTHRQQDLTKILPAESLIQLSPNWSRLAWTNPQSGRVGVIDLPNLKDTVFTLPTGLPVQDTVINSIDWSYDGSRVLVDSVSSAMARRNVWVDPASMEPEASLGYDPSRAPITEAALLASMKEQYWALDPDNGLAEPIAAVLMPNVADVEPYPRQFLHFYRKGQDIGTDWDFVCELCNLQQPLPDILLHNGALIAKDEYGGIYLFQPDGRVRLVQAPLPSSVKLPWMSRKPTNLWAVFDDNYVLYWFNNQSWLYGVRENIKAPFPADFSAHFQF